MGALGILLPIGGPNQLLGVIRAILTSEFVDRHEGGPDQ
jgi:hypothetical protein